MNLDRKPLSHGKPVAAVTVAVRPAVRRAGSTHTYFLNGTLLRDELIDGAWVSRCMVEVSESRAA
ncbi:MAG: hypothetical protein RXR20_00910 [Paraburkholderia sp.]|jgi:hypothetical protein|uniref:hypothetical protein n=1 Tax=Burkholderiaceae TaxID=119060 RepID=UPI0010F4DF08|nr:hypothetical protein [Burkholderia sp. 4M9327F10]